MKICFSSTGKDLGSMLDVRFGRCSYFLIYDAEGQEVKVIENRGQMAGGGAGIAAAQQIIDEGVDVVITGNLGPNAFDILKKSDIKVYRCGSTKIDSALQLFKEGKLEEISVAGPAHAGMGAGKRFRGGR
ncbi:Predicted Fe-Mo cluster-binding protein, NifX family [Anaerobranca californiensis DSM 14826]|jgi:predicted Fe-Mo cluster-binding NifX family protein|uniref:Predicted Fe-Mo cluster-binding protein, NifX family n=1 Tax=Anaerobranca californiensis DSM 14826 TaxID=1120989 RepID=A0A1M6MX09_9FIRM|nr:NifB/NifX family molybdenum-iron cluster-binding protein [Anaerobranca californiensis]SHJ87976.1 Predicted Fe-Mo cluster-binding protein, NifX family [Anaerobranca californiensis DSM 14826]